jgi:lamin tail-like protein
VKQINSFLSALTRIYSQQGQVGKILIPGLILLVFCFLCSILISLFPLASRNSSSVVPSPNLLPSVETGATPTALFSFGSGTFTPFPTFPVPSALPTLTSLPTATETPTQTIPAATETALPTVTNPPPATIASSGVVLIAAVNKAMEYVDLQNVGNAPVDLQGWKLVSETGSQSCALSGVLQPNVVLRVWARKGDSGFSCGFSFNIWNDNQSDPAVLYNAQGEVVSRFP